MAIGRRGKRILLTGLACVAMELIVGFDIGTGRLIAASRLDANTWVEFLPPPTTRRLSVEGAHASAVRGTSANDELLGSEDGDQLDGASGDDAIYGQAGDDRARGGPGDDYLQGGVGDDSLLGNEGDDRYFFLAGDGVDRVDDTRGSNTIIFGSAVGKHPIRVERSDDEYVISYGARDEIHLSGHSFSTFRFISRSSLMAADEFLQLYAIGEIAYPRVAATSSGKRELRAGPLGDPLIGTPADEVLIGGAGNEILFGGGGNDEYQPGRPAGALAVGGPGNDSYVFSKDAGRLVIQESGGTDEIRFGSGIRPADVTILDVGDQLLFVLAGSPHARTDAEEVDRWSLYVWQRDRLESQRVERVVFANGSIWDDSEVRRRTRMVQVSQ